MLNDAIRALLDDAVETMGETLADLYDCAGYSAEDRAEYQAKYDAAKALVERLPKNNYQPTPLFYIAWEPKGGGVRLDEFRPIWALPYGTGLAEIDVALTEDHAKRLVLANHGPDATYWNWSQRVSVEARSPVDEPIPSPPARYRVAIYKEVTDHLRMDVVVEAATEAEALTKALDLDLDGVGVDFAFHACGDNDTPNTAEIMGPAAGDETLTEDLDRNEIGPLDG